METKNLTDKNLIDLLNFEQNKLYLDGREILNVQGNQTCAQINIVSTNGNSIYVGTGACCHGYLLELEKRGDSFKLDDFFSVDFNIFEMMPIVGRLTKSSCIN